MFWGTGNHLGLFLEVILVKVPLVFIKVTMAKMACPNLVSLTFWGNFLCGIYIKKKQKKTSKHVAPYPHVLEC